MSQITSEQLLQRNVFGDSSESGKAFIEVLKAISEQLKVVIKLTAEVSKGVDTGDKRQIQEVNEAFKQRTEALKELERVEKLKRDQEKELAKLAKQEIELQKTLSGENDKRVKQQLELNEARKQQRQRLKGVIEAEKEQLGTLERLAIENRKLRKERQELNLDTEKGQKRVLEINAELDKNNGIIKKNSDRLKQQKLNVGNYNEAVDRLTPILGKYGKRLTNIRNNLRQNSEALKGLAGITNLFSRETLKAVFNLRTLRVALAATGIGLIVAALGLLVKAFSSTQRNIDRLNSVLIPLRVVFETLFGQVQDLATNGFDFLANAIENPIQAFTSLKDTIFDFIETSFKPLKLAGLAIGDLLTGDFVKASERAGEALTALTDNVKSTISVFTDFGQAQRDVIDEAIERGRIIAALTVQIEEGENDLIVTRERLNLVTREQNKLADDTTQSVDDRIEALKEATAAQEELILREQRQLDLRIRRIKLEQQSNDTSRADIKELRELEAQRFRVAASATRLLTTLQNKLNKLKKEELETEKDLAKALELRGRVEEVELEKNPAGKRAQTAIEAAEAETKKLNEETLKRFAIREEERKKEEQAIKDQIQNRLELAQAGINFLEDLNKRIQDKTLEAIDDQLEATKEQRSLLQAEAAEGNKDALEALQDLDKRQAELAAQRKEENEKQRQDEILLAAIKLFAENIGTSTNPLATTLGQLGQLEGLVAALPSLKVGIEDTTSLATGKNVDGQGGFLMVGHGGERWMDKESNIKTRGLSNELLADIGFRYKRGELIEKGRQADNVAAKEALAFESLRELTAIREELKEHKVLKDSHYDELTKSFVERMKYKNGIENRHHKTNVL